MRMVVVIATHGRKAIVGQLLKHLERQSRPPDEVVLSVPDLSDLEEVASSQYRIKVIAGRKGLCAQRNQALDYVLPRFDVITFFDDDFVPADDYLERLEQLFIEQTSWSVVTGRVIQDGARTSPLTFAAGLDALDAIRGIDPEPGLVIDLAGVYGCNMSMRAAAVGDLRFDERLALYGWQEDVDFSSQMRSSGRVVLATVLRGVHLGAANGRVSGYRLGYSQVVNPVYLIRKGTIGLSYGASLLGRNVVSNLLRSVRPEPHIDRRGRLRGNLLGFLDIMRGRIEPERILSL